MSLYSLQSKLFGLAPEIASLLFRPVETRVRTTKKEVYLTFDDGPTDATSLLVDLLQSLSIEATFFWTGSNVNKHLDTTTVDTRFISLGNHFFDHRDPWLMRSRTMRESVERSRREIGILTGVEPTLLRPPYGHVTPATVAMARDNGTRIVLWDVMPGDFLNGVQPEDMVSVAIRRIKPGSIIVLHDHGVRHFETVLVPFITSLHVHMTNAGYQFSRLLPE